MSHEPGSRSKQWSGIGETEEWRGDPLHSRARRLDRDGRRGGRRQGRATGGQDRVPDAARRAGEAWRGGNVGGDRAVAFAQGARDHRRARDGVVCGLCGERAHRAERYVHQARRRCPGLAGRPCSRGCAWRGIPPLDLRTLPPVPGERARRGWPIRLIPVALLT